MRAGRQSLRLGCEFDEHALDFLPRTRPRAIGGATASPGTTTPSLAITEITPWASGLLVPGGQRTAVRHLRRGRDRPEHDGDAVNCSTRSAAGSPA
jgi:hypothetical protein